MTGIDPASWADRSCKGIDPDVFFPKRTDNQALAYAQDFCEGCPRLRECAAYAGPLARSGALTQCVIAAVLLPGHYGGQDARDEVADELEAVAERGLAHILEAEGAA